MMSFSGQASWTKMMSLGGKLTVLTCHSTIKVKKSEEPTYLFRNIDLHQTNVVIWGLEGCSNFFYLCNYCKIMHTLPTRHSHRILIFVTKAGNFPSGASWIFRSQLLALLVNIRLGWKWPKAKKCRTNNALKIYIIKQYEELVKILCN